MAFPARLKRGHQVGHLSRRGLIHKRDFADCEYTSTSALEKSSILTRFPDLFQLDDNERTCHQYKPLALQVTIGQEHTEAIPYCSLH